MPSEDVLLRMKVDTSDFSSKMREINNSMRDVKAEFKSNVAGMSNWKTSAEGVKSKISSLGKEYELLKQKLNAQKSALKDQQTGYTENAQKAEMLKAKLQELKDQGVSETSEEYKKYKTALTSVQAEMERQGNTCNKLKTDIKNTESAMKQNEVQTNSYKTSLSKLEAEMQKNSSAHEKLKSTISKEKSELDSLKSKYTSVVLEQGKNSTEAKKLEAEIVKLNSSLNKHKSELSNAEQAADALTREHKSLADCFKEGLSSANLFEGGIQGLAMSFGGALVSGIQSGISAIGDFIKSSIQVGMGFETSMSKVQALSGATKEEFNSLSETARYWGQTTQFSASECADALGYMALAGWNSAQMTDALPSVLNLSAAGAMDLAQASDMVTDVLSAYGMTAKDAGLFSDQLAYAQANTNTSAQQLGGAFQNCAVMAHSFGQDARTTTAMLGMLANEQLKGNMAGTAMSAVFRDMSAKMKDGAISIGQTKVAVTDANGNFRNMIDILKDIEGATDGMSDSQKTAALATTFTADSTKAMNILLNEGSKKTEDFARALDGCAGTAEEMAKVMNDNLEGDLKSMNSAIEDVQISIEEALAPALRGCVQMFTGIVIAIGNFIKSMMDGSSQLTIFSDIWNGLWTVVQTIWSTIGQPVFDMIKDVLAEFVENIKEHLPEIQETWEKVCAVISEVWEGVLKPVFDALKVVVEESMNAFRTAFSIALDAVTMFSENLSSFFNNVILPAVKNLVDIVTSLLQGDWSGAWDSAKNLVKDFVTGVGQWLNECVSNIGQFIGDAVGKLGQFVSDSVGKAIEFAQQFPENIKTGMVNFLTSIKSSIDEGVKNFTDGARNMIDGFVQGIGEGIGTAVNAVLDFGNQCLDAFKGLFGIHSPSTVMAEQGQFITEGLAQGLQDMPSAIMGIFGDVLSNATSWASDMIGKGLEAGKGFFKNVKDNISQVPVNVKEHFSNIISNTTTWAGNFANKAKESATNFFKNVKDNVSKVPSNVQGYFTSAVSNATSWSSNFANKAMTAGRNFLSFIKNEMGSLGGTVANLTGQATSSANSWAGTFAQIATRTGSNFKSNLTSSLSGLYGAMTSVGSQICSGIGAGISSGWSWLTGQVSNLASGLLGSAKNALGIKSPSRKFRDLVGKQIPAGIAQGVKNNSKQAVTEVKRLSESLIGSVGSFKSRVSESLKDEGIYRGSASNAYRNASKAVSEGSQIVYNFNQTNNSPKALSRKEIYRQTKNALSFAGGK